MVSLLCLATYIPTLTGHIFQASTSLRKLAKSEDTEE